MICSYKVIISLIVLSFVGIAEFTIVPVEVAQAKSLEELRKTPEYWERKGNEQIFYINFWIKIIPKVFLMKNYLKPLKMDGLKL